MAVAQFGTSPIIATPIIDSSQSSPSNQTAPAVNEGVLFNVKVIEIVNSKAIVRVLSGDLTPEDVKRLIIDRSFYYGIKSELPIAIARCESQLQQYNKAGEVLRGKANRYDVGIFQINEQYHLERSQELGFDIYTPEGNVGYATWLMSTTAGRGPWVWSRHCWDPKLSKI